MDKKLSTDQMLMLLVSFAIMLLCAPCILAADAWQIERLNIKPDLNASAPAIASDGTNVYAAWVEEAGPTTGTARRVMVKKNDGSGWVRMGTTASITGTAGDAADPDIVCTDSSIWVAAEQIGAAGNSVTSKIVVARWNGTDWQNAGTLFKNENANCNGVSLAHYHDLVYASWIEMQELMVLGNYSARHNGSGWEDLGQSSEDCGMYSCVRSVDMAVDPITGTPYKANLRLGSEGLTAVHFYTGTAWQQQGNSFSENLYTSSTLDHDGTNLVVTSGEMVIKWNGSDWEPLGGNIGYWSFTIIKLHNNIPYIFCSQGTSPYNSLRYYNGSDWVAWGDPVVVSNDMHELDPDLVFHGDLPCIVWQELRPSDSRTNVYAAHPPLPTSRTTPSVLQGNMVIAYPNPAKARVTFAYAVEKAGKVTISMYNFNAQLVSRIIDEYAGPNPAAQSIWDLKDVASGAYICRFVMEPNDGSGKAVKTLKLSVVK